MIKITTNTNRYESPVFSHPARTGTQSASYTFTHNFNADPDIIQPYVQNGATWTPALTFDSDGSLYYGYDFPSQPVDRNQTTIRIYNQGPTLNMKVVFIRH